MAAAVLAQEPPSRPPAGASAARLRRRLTPPAGGTGHRRRGGVDLRPGSGSGGGRPGRLAAAERAKDGAELVGALAAQLRSRFGVAAVAVWLLDADGALDLFGQDGLDGTESSRWRRLPPQFDCLEQRVVADGSDLWWPAGLPRGRPGARRRAVGEGRRPRGARAAGPGGHPARRGRGVVADARGGVFDVATRDLGVGRASPGSPTCSACGWPTAPWDRRRRRPPIFAALDEITESALVVRPLRDAGGTVTDFGIIHLSPRYVDPGGRPAAELAGLTLLEAYPASASGDGLFAMAERVLASGRAEHVTGDRRYRR